MCGDLREVWSEQWKLNVFVLIESESDRIDSISNDSVLKHTHTHKQPDTKRFSALFAIVYHKIRSERRTMNSAMSPTTQYRHVRIFISKGIHLNCQHDWKNASQLQIVFFSSSSSSSSILVLWDSHSSLTLDSFRVVVVLLLLLCVLPLHCCVFHLTCDRFIA